MNPIAALLAQAAGPQFAEAFLGQQPQEPDPNAPIVVKGSPPVEDRVNVDGPDAPFMGNRNVLDEAAYSASQAPERKGRFGVRGTLRDILGTVGDAFLVQAGKDPLYYNRRQQERQGDAMAGFTQGGESAQAAMERLAAGGFGKEAQTLYDSVQSSQLKDAQLKSLQLDRQDKQNDRRQGNILDLSNRAARILASAKTPEQQQYAMGLIGKLAAANGLTMDDIGLSADITPEQRGIYSAGDMTVNQQELLPRRDRQLDISQNRAESQRISATKPRAASTRSQTELEYFKEIGNIPENQRTPSQQAFYKKYTEGTRSAKPSRGVPPAINNVDTSGWRVRRN